MTTPELLFKATNGTPMPSGPERCACCGASCNTSIMTASVIRGTFTAFATLRCRGSLYACAGCQLAMGTTRDKQGKLAKPFLRSWIITAEEAGDHGPADPDLRGACLNPPLPPYSIAIAAGGQKHQLYLTPVNLDRARVSVCLDTVICTYAPRMLAERLEIYERVAAATGKPSLKDRPGQSACAGLARYHTEWESIYQQWSAVHGDALHGLAAHLCRRMELCQNDYSRTVG